MRIDRGEAGGTAAALLLHVLLIAALTTSLAKLPPTAEPPPVEVEFVDTDEVAMTAAAPAPATPPPAAEAPAPTVEPSPAPPEPAPAPPLPQPLAPPPPVARPLPQRPAPPAARPQPQRPAPRQTRPTPAPAPAPARPAPARQSRIGDDFLKGIPNPDRDLAPRPETQGAATYNAAAKANVNSAILRQIKPCADRQPTLGPGADRIRVTVNLRLDRSGRLSRPPALVRTSGVDEDNAKFEDLAYDQAVTVFRQCAPLRLPAELYSTPQGGWGNINLNYSAK